MPDYPLRAFSLADAGRSFDRAGDTEQALALLERAHALEVPGALPDYLDTRRRELAALKP